jgi:hypothetical protein
MGHFLSHEQNNLSILDFANARHNSLRYRASLPKLPQPSPLEDFCLSRAGARLTGPGLREPDADAGATGGVRGRAARGFRSHRGWMGKDGNDSYSAGYSERGCTGRRLTHGMEATA